MDERQIEAPHKNQQGLMLLFLIAYVVLGFVFIVYLTKKHDAFGLLIIPHVIIASTIAHILKDNATRS